MTTSDHLIKAVNILRRGGIIAYPTEAVFGLGCDPFNKAAVKNLSDLKNRDKTKGLILIAANWQQVAHLTQPLPPEVLQRAFATWPGPVTWLFPASPNVPSWLGGQPQTIALRITAHPVAQAICTIFEGPITSTSANLTSQQPALTTEEVAQQFPKGIDYIVPGLVGGSAKPSMIGDVVTGKIIRE